VKLTRALNKELDQAMKDICQFDDQEVEVSQRIIELVSLCKKHEKVIEKLKKENATLELMVQSHDELIMEIATETGLNMMGRMRMTMMTTEEEMLPHLLLLGHLLLPSLSWLSRRRKTT
jgi:hypothetical protein